MFSPDNLKQFCSHLQAGDVVAAPAEGVYGYCADPFNPKALEKLLALKKRTSGKGFITLIKDWQQLEELTIPLLEQEKTTLQGHWPGRVTCILPATKNLPELLTGGRNTIAVRMPAADYMHEYLKAWGQPLVSTSANISGQPPATTSKAVLGGVFALECETPLDGGVSAVLDLKSGVRVR